MAMPEAAQFGSNQSTLLATFFSNHFTAAGGERRAGWYGVCGSKSIGEAVTNGWRWVARDQVKKGVARRDSVRT